MDVVGTVQEITRYPVKSMEGEPLAEVEVGHDGLDGDRTLALHDRQTGRIASAKRPDRFARLLGCRSRVVDGEVRVTLPDGREHRGDDPALTTALSRLLDRQVSVVVARPGALGSYDSTWPEVDGVDVRGEHELANALATDAVRFVNVAPLHLVTTATLRRLAGHASWTSFDPRRLRPNLVVDVADPDGGYVEDGWRGRVLRIGDDLEVEVTMPTPRCVMTTLERPGLACAPQVLVAAARNRHTARGYGTFACAGAYADVRVPGRVTVGAPVRLR